MFPWITSSIIKNCGTGAGGFQAGNTCATGGAVDVNRIDLEKFAPRENWERFSPTAALTNYLEILRRTDRKMGDDPSDNSNDFNQSTKKNPFYPKSQSDPKEVQNLANLLAFYTNRAYAPMARAVLWSEKDGMGFIPSPTTNMANLSVSDNDWLQFLTDNHGLVGFNSDKNDGSELFRDNFEKSYRQACVSAHDQLSGALQQTELDSGRAVIYRGSTIRGIQSPAYSDGDSEEKIESKINSLVKAFETKGVDMKSNTSWSKSSVIASSFSTSGNSGSTGLPVVFAVQGFKAGLDVYWAEKYIKPNIESQSMDKLEQEVVVPPTKIRVVGVDKLYIKGKLSALVVRGEAVAKPIKAPKKPKKDFNFIQNVLKNCGTGAGGFQAGNTCGSGTGQIEIQFETTTKDVYDLFDDGLSRNFIYGCPEVAPCDQATNLPNAKIKERLLFEIYSGNGYKDILNGDDEDHGIDERTIDEFVQGGYMSFEDEKSTGIDIQQYDLWQEETRSAIPEIRRMLNESAQNTEIVNMPKDQSVFRGISVNSKEIDKFINGLKDGVLETEKPQSWSKSILIAHQFAAVVSQDLNKQIPVVLRASGIKRGVDMNQSNLANRRSELEMVLPSAQYKIKNVRVFKGDDDRVKLVEVDVET